MDDKLRRLLGDTARAARLRQGLTQAEVARQVRLKPGVYGRVERGKMTPSVPTLRRICATLGLSSDVLLSLAPRAQPGKVSAAKRSSEPTEPPELSRIIHLLRDWPPERLSLARKLLETADSHFSR
jgi:transcriptional regulator with XRE-family HTH domain